MRPTLSAAKTKILPILAAVATLATFGLLIASAAIAANRYGADYFPNLSLLTQDGASVRFYDDMLKDKLVAINVIYTSCKDECPLETARLAQLQKILGERMGRDIHFISITIDPKHDTPEVLKAYTGKFGVGPAWSFLTGQPDDIKVVVKKLGLSRNSDAQNKDGHTASLMVGNVPKGLWLRLSAVDNPQFLAAKIATFLGKWPELLPQKNYAEVRSFTIDQTQYLFQYRCSACHTIGQGEKIGPDLAGVTERRQRPWFNRYLTEPDKMRAEGDPAAVALSEKYKTVRMPNQALNPVERNALFSYLETRTNSVRKDSANAGERTSADKLRIDGHHEH